MSKKDDETLEDRGGKPSGDRERDVEIPSHDEETARLREENARLEERLKRAMADLANFRRRQVKDLEDARRRTVEGLAAELLPVLDNFAFAIDAWDRQGGAEGADPQAVLDGVRMVQTLLTGALERHGLEPIADRGEPFDPNVHEAVGVEPRDDVEDGVVLEVLQRGYRLGDKVLRPSKVTVSGSPEQQQGSGDEKGDDPPPQDGEE